MKTVCVIPARYASTRLPGKPLALLAGKPMIQHVYEQAVQARGVQEVLVATDDERIVKAVEVFGGQAILTSSAHPTGTDRLAEVARKHTDADIIINVQGDEPLVEPQVIEALAAAFVERPALQMATLCTPLLPEEAAQDSVVKVVLDQKGYALYFSRSLIPFPRKPGLVQTYKHLGLYGYRRDFLLEYAAMKPTPLEQTESLEQLRALEYGHKILVLPTEHASVGVDTPEDLKRVEAILLSKGKR